MPFQERKLNSDSYYIYFFSGDEKLKHIKQADVFYFNVNQGLSQDLETGCLNWAIVKYLGVQKFEGDNNILIFQP